ncbi:MAG: hypothetical protein H6Q67_2311 [Firmicutes bacterium]|nr:hypothetical protein [Bacillota bacterium]
MITLKKLLLSTFILLILLCSVAVASPLTDYSQGRGAIDLTERNTKISIKDSVLGTSDFPQKYNLDTTFTFGLGNKLAVQYRYFNPKSQNYYSSSHYLQLKVSQLNVLYQLEQNISAFIGFTDGTFSSVYEVPAYNQTVSYSYNRQCMNVGLLGQTQIAPKTNLWGSVNGGKSFTEYNIGVGYQIKPNLEFNVDYRNFKIKKYFSYGAQNVDAFGKGLGFGLTYKY